MSGAVQLSWRLIAKIDSSISDLETRVPPDAREPDGIRKPSPPIRFEPGIKALIRSFTWTSIKLHPTRVAPNLEFQETEVETGSEPDGETAKVLGPKDDMSSGLGGLGLDGMVGSDDSVGESSPPPGEGNRGVMSGDRAGEGEDNGDDDDDDDGDDDDDDGGSDAGAAEIVFDADDNWEEYEKDKMHKAISMLSAIK
ncbi:hypothetical protein R6Q59_020386 [Mikania micrantha]